MKRKPFFYPIARAICVFIFNVIYPTEIQNGKCLPKDESVIVCSNHVSNLDPVMLNYSQKTMVLFMAKKELFKNKLFAKFIESLGAFPVDRGQDGGKAIENAKKLLQEGNCIGVFLEGTRSKTGELGRGHGGAFMIAHQTNTPIIPCCITPSEKFLKKRKKTKITYGEPVTCEELGIVEGTTKEYREAARRFMEILAQMREKQRSEFQE